MEVHYFLILFIRPEHVDVGADDAADPGAQGGGAHAHVPHHRGEQLRREDVDLENWDFDYQ